MNPFKAQVILTSESFLLRPLMADDFDALYEVANDPLLWQQHPQHDRWQKPVFEAFFNTALTNPEGCYVIVERESMDIVGSSRFYDYSSTDSCIRLGFTFIARRLWGSQANGDIKHAMLEYAFSQVENVLFDVGIKNFRSRRALEKLGAKIQSLAPDDKVVYCLTKTDYPVTNL